MKKVESKSAEYCDNCGKVLPGNGRPNQSGLCSNCNTKQAGDKLTLKRRLIAIVKQAGENWEIAEESSQRSYDFEYKQFKNSLLFHHLINEMEKV